MADENLYLIIIHHPQGIRRKWLPIVEAGRTSNSYMVQVEIGKRVMEPDGTERETTREEYNKMIDIANEWDERKKST